MAHLDAPLPFSDMNGSASRIWASESGGLLYCMKQIGQSVPWLHIEVKMKPAKRRPIITTTISV
jgi:hypothetical protein